MNMLRNLVGHGAAGNPPSVDRPFLEAEWNRPMMSADHQVLAVLQEHAAIIGVTNLTGAVDDGLERRTDVGRRGGDHLEDVAAAGLIDKCFAEIVGALAQLPKQA